MSANNSSDAVRKYDKWLTITEACHALGVSRRTIERRIKQGEIESELREGIRYVKLNIGADMSHELSYNLAQLEVENARFKKEIEELRVSVRKLEDKLEGKEEDLRRKDEQMAEAGHRHDTVVMQMTKLLEYHQQPFWRKLFQRKQLPQPVEDTTISEVKAKKNEL